MDSVFSSYKRRKTASSSQQHCHNENDTSSTIMKIDTPTPAVASSLLPPSITSCVVYVGGIHHGMSVNQVCQLMQPYGTIVSPLNGGVRVLEGCAFVQYSTIRESQAAIAALNGRMLMGSQLRVQPALTTSTSSVKQQQQQQSSPLFLQYPPLQPPQQMMMMQMRQQLHNELTTTSPNNLWKKRGFHCGGDHPSSPHHHQFYYQEQQQTPTAMTIA